jgi:chain length determinant protein EpsF
MTFSQLLSILHARWRSALLVLLATLGATISVSLLLPKKYTATASVMLDVRSPDPIAGMVMAGMLTPGYMATQVDLMSSERVARRAIQALGLNNNAAMREQWIESTGGQGDFEAWVADALLKNLDIKPSRESTVITIGYTSPDPGFSAALANAFMQAYVDTTRELRVDPARQYNSFFDTRAKQLRDDLEGAQRQLSSYQKSRGILATDERLDVENSRLAELSTQLVMLQAAAAESGSRQAQAGTRPGQMQEVMNNPLVATLSSDLAREETRLKELNSRLGDNHPQVTETRARLKELRSRLDAATVQASGSVSVTNNVNQGRVAQARASLDAQRAKVMQLKTVRDDAAVLQRDVENAQRAYDAMAQRVNQTSVESANTQTNVSIIKTATPPAVASFPRLFLNIAAALFAGLILALGTALVRELFDRRMRNGEDVTVELRQPLLVVLPVSKAALAGKETSRVRMIKARVLSGLPRPGPAT